MSNLNGVHLLEMISLTMLAAFMVQQGGLSMKPRFASATPLPGLPSITIDTALDGIGLAQPMARNRGVQARILWIDATANIDRYNSDEKIVALVAQIKAAGFNTVVFDVKPISGQVVYKSALAPKIEEWRGRHLPLDYDPLATMSTEVKAAGTVDASQP